MGDRTGISWTDSTWNPIRGCSRVSQGCVHCYAETVAGRFSKPGQAYEGLVDKNGRWNGKIMLVQKHLTDPLRWRRGRKIFVNSMSDLFHENIKDETIASIFAVMALAPQHTFQILTKRPARMRAWFEWVVKCWPEIEYMHATIPPDSNIVLHHGPFRDDRYVLALAAVEDTPAQPWPLPNVWLGVSVENQATAEERIPLLLQTPAAVRWISAEPLLDAIELVPFLNNQEHGNRALDWVVVGGESGPGHRPMEPWWLSAIATECFAWRVPVFVKQDSGARSGEQGRLNDALWALKQFPPSRVDVDAGPVLDLMEALKTSLRGSSA